MSDVIGPRNVGGSGNSSSPYATQGPSASPGDLGDKLRKKVDDEVDRILSEQYDRGMSILTENHDVLEAVANLLLEKEKINGLELIELIRGMRPELVPSSTMVKVEQFTNLLKTGKGADSDVQLAA